jgi:outer membrane protein assembly factor BamB
MDSILKKMPGRRARLWSQYACLLLLTGCSTLQADRTDLYGESGWFTEGATVERQHAISEEIAAPLEEVWEYNAAAGFGPGSPLLLRNTALVATRKGEVHAINLETGKKAGVEGFGDAINGTPLVKGDLLYVPIAKGRRAMYAYNLRKGERAWDVKGAPVETGLLSVDGGIIAVDAEATVRRYDQSPEPAWEQPLGDRITVHATPLLAGGRLIVVNDAGDVVAMDPTDGSVQWTVALASPVYTSVAANEFTIFVPTTRGRFFALDATQGHIVWKFSVPDSTVRFAAPAVDGNLVIFGASDGVVRAFDAKTGALQWTFEDDAAMTAPPLLTPETVYIGTMGQMLLALDRADGQLRWEYELKGRLKSAMAASDGQLLVLSEPRYVYLFRSAPSVGPVASEQ